MPIRFTFAKEHSFIYYNRELKNYSLHNKMKFIPPQIIFILVFVILLQSGCDNTTGVKLESYPVIRFSKTYFQGEINNVLPASDGGFVSLGWITTANANEHLSLLKTDQDGIIEWSKKYGNNSDYPNSLLKTKDGGYLILAIRGRTSPKYGELLIIKTDEHGNEVWSNSYEDSLYYDDGVSIQVSNDGGYVIASSRQWTWNRNTSEYIIFKISESGDVIWRKVIYQSTINKPLNGKPYIACGSNGYFILSRLYNYSDNDSILIVKTDLSGNIIWQKKYASIFIPRSLITLLDGNFMASGIIYLNSHSYAGLMKINSNGEIEWTKIYQGKSYQSGIWDQFCSVVETNDGKIIAVGSTNRTVKTSLADAWIMQTDQNGNEIWSYIFPGIRSDVLYSVKHVRENSYIAAGSTANGDNPNETAWLLNFDLTPCEQWVKKK